MKQIKCPTCGTPTVWEGNPSRPFCSDRCQLIDLGKWADEEYKIPGSTTGNMERPDIDRPRDEAED